MRPERCRECGLAGRLCRPAPGQSAGSDKSWGRRVKAPEKGRARTSGVRSWRKSLGLHQLLIDVINRMPESRGRAIISRLHFIGKWCHRAALVPNLPGRSVTQRPVRPVLIVVILPLLQLFREVRRLQVNSCIELLGVRAL